MQDIQTVGSEILNHSPRSFYIFAGLEYGIKCKYIEILRDYYGSQIECNTVQSVLDMMNTKHLVPLDPALYVVRYDDDFVKNLDNQSSEVIDSCNIVGTIVCLYESGKSVEKLDKYLSDYVVDISGISNKFTVKYLRQEFPDIPDDLVEKITKISMNFEHSRNICRSISKDNIDYLYSMPESGLRDLFGVTTNSKDSMFKIAVASRNFARLVELLDQYEDIDGVFYIFLNTLIELEKLKWNSHAESLLRKYASDWSIESVYNMFTQVYFQLKQVRKYSCDSMLVLIHLFALLRFKDIPSVEVMI